MKLEYSEIFRTILDIEDERHEHELVLEAIKDLESSRNCWRLIGGVLVAKSQTEISEALKQSVQEINQTLTIFNSKLKQREKDLIEFEQCYNIKSSRSEEPPACSVEAKGKEGVLA